VCDGAKVAATKKELFSHEKDGQARDGALCNTMSYDAYMKDLKAKESIYSVTWQSHTNWLLYVLGPAALLDSILVEFADPRIQFAPTEPARAKAFASLMIPKTRHVLRMKAGEVWSPGHLLDRLIDPNRRS
jgi:hypothetical protein